MADDILNNTGGTNGQQRQGRAYVNTGGRGGFSQIVNTVDVSVGLVTTSINSIREKYDARFDDPRNYTGDADSAGTAD